MARCLTPVGWSSAGRAGYLVLDVPKAAQAAMDGKRRLVKSLKTRDLSVARLRRWAVLAEMQRAIAEAQRKPAVDPLMAEALEAVAGLRPTVQ